MADAKEIEKQEREEGGGGEERTEMKPWEQHSAVISIPRFDYNAPSSLLRHSHSGFLVTCPIKREKSATKEAISIFEKCIGFLNSGSFQILGNVDANIAGKRRKLCEGEIEGKCPVSVEIESAVNSVDSDEKLLEDSCLASAESDTNARRSPILSLVKLTRSGLLLFTVPSQDSPDVLGLVSKVISLLESGSLSSPLWCHRIFPIQATCCLNEKELDAAVSKLVTEFVNDKRNELERPIKFAVGYNRRGIEETEMKNPRKTLAKIPEELALLDRNKCLSFVAAAVKNVVSDSVVDLKSPELSVLVEVLPLSGVPNGSVVVAVSVLPRNLVTAKPRLCVKALLSDTKARNGKKNKEE